MYMRTLFLAAAVLLSASCSFAIKKDPNLIELTASAERQLELTLEHDRLVSAQRQKDNAECMLATSEGAMAICFLGKTASTLANDRGGSGSSNLQPILPAYSPPPTALQQAGQFLASATPLTQVITGGLVSFDATRQANQTTRVISAHNTQREISTVQAQAGVSTALANQAPGIQIGAGGVYSAGPVTQIGGNNAGGHYNESGTLIADSPGVNTGVQMGDRGINGDGNTAAEITDSGNCVAGAGGNGASGAAGGTGGLGGASSGAAGGNAGSGATGGPGGSGGAGGPGGSCTPSPIVVPATPRP